MPRRAPTASFLIIGALVLAACAGGSQSPELSPTAASAAAAQCPSIDLRGPDGTAPDLSGTWIGIGDRRVLPRPGRYELNSLNSCLAWVGRSTDEGEDAGASWMNVFVGKVNSDFTISGDWAVVAASEDFCSSTTGGGGARCNRARGTLILRIEWVPTAEGNRVRLVLQEYTKIGSAGGLGGFVTSVWVRPGDEALFDVPVE
jgi:hypothetical protein